jgi:hypothetical protein
MGDNNGFAQWDAAPVFDGEAGGRRPDRGPERPNKPLSTATQTGVRAAGQWCPPGRPLEWSVDIVSGPSSKLVTGRTILTTTNGAHNWRVTTSNLAFAAGDQPDFVTDRVGLEHAL